MATEQCVTDEAKGASLGHETLARKSLVVQRELAAAAQMDGVQVRLETVQAMTGYGTSSIYKRMREGTFPKPVRRNPRCVRWIAGDVKAWLAQAHKPTTA
jgi:prophage regulatory protein